METEEKIKEYTFTDLENDIIKDVRSEIQKEDLETKGLYSRKMIIEKNIIQRIWYSLLTKMLGSFSLNIQLKRNGVVIFEYEIPKK